MDCLGHDIVGCRVAEAILGQLWVESCGPLLFEDLEPTLCPTGRLRICEHPLRYRGKLGPWDQRVKAHVKRYVTRKRASAGCGAPRCS
eukprot:219513-Prymnesium_polylepis.1